MSVSVWAKLPDAAEDDYLNFSNHSFRGLMNFLGLDLKDDLAGTLDLKEIATLKAKAEFALTTLRFTYDDSVLHAEPPAIWQIDVHDPRYLHRRLSDLVALFEAALEAGTPIHFG